MDKKVVVITGGGSGLGASLARKLSAKGYYVCLLGRTDSKLKEVGKSLTHDHSTYQVDVASYDEVHTVFETIKNKVGNIDLLINNAGIGVFELAEDLNEQAVHEQIDINLKGTIFCTQAVLTDMKKRDSGIIANIISTAGLEGKATESVYAASKFGMRGFTESLEIELESTNVNAFAAYMGGMKTEFWDGIYEEENTGHLMDPNDIADIIIHNIQSRNKLKVTEVVIKNNI